MSRVAKLNSRQIQVDGYLPKERLIIKAKSIKQAFVRFGKVMEPVTISVLEKIFVNKDQLSTISFQEAGRQTLAKLRELAETEMFVAGGTNYLKRYLQAISGFAEGSGITEEEAVLLQLEIETGCQTIVVRDPESEIVRFVHTEENGDDLGLSEGKFDYRVTTLEFPGRKITFFAYPGLCGWGPAFGLNLTTGMVQMVDDLYQRPEFNGSLPIQAVSFMILDCGRQVQIEHLLAMLNSINGNKFNKAYALHLVWSGKSPVVKSYELAGDSVAEIPLDSYSDRQTAAQANFPRDSRHFKFSTACKPEGLNWSLDEAKLYVEMSRRQKRLELLAKYANWLGKNPYQSVEFGRSLLADQYGDIGFSQSSQSYYHTGLASKWTAGYLVGYLSPSVNKFFIGKLIPEVIPSKEYVIELGRQGLALSNLEELAQKEFLQYNNPGQNK